MQVETFECEEVKNEHPEIAFEALKIIDDLDLAGQKALTEPGEKSRFPYRKMTDDESFVYAQLCPQRTTLRDYGDDPIPLRVLQVAAHAKPLFGDLIVLHRASADVKDPVLIGVKNPNSYTDSPFILARWGEHLDEWPAMVKAALAVWREGAAARLRKMIARCQSDSPNIETMGLSEAMRWSLPSEYSF